MTKIIAAWNSLRAILADGKITNDEAPAFLAALSDLVSGVVEVILPFFSKSAGLLATNFSTGLKLAANQRDAGPKK